MNHWMVLYIWILASTNDLKQRYIEGFNRCLDHDSCIEVNKNPLRQSPCSLTLAAPWKDWTFDRGVWLLAYLGRHYTWHIFPGYLILRQYTLTLAHRHTRTHTIKHVGVSLPKIVSNNFVIIVFPWFIKKMLQWCNTFFYDRNYAILQFNKWSHCFALPPKSLHYSQM